MTHGQHAKAAQLFRCIKDHRWEAARHFGVQTNLDTGLDLVFTLHKQVEELLCVHYSLSEVSHQANQSSVPFVDNLDVKADCRKSTIHPS